MSKSREGQQVPVAMDARDEAGLAMLTVVDFSEDKYITQIRAMLVKDYLAQPYSHLDMGSQRIVVLWDTGCNLPGLMSAAKFEELREQQPGAVHSYVKYARPRPVSGISDPPAKLVGQALLKITFEGRLLVVATCIMENGDTGKAALMIGNRSLWCDRWGGCVDFVDGMVHLQSPDDGLGRLSVPITWSINHEEIKTAEDAAVWRDKRAVWLAEQEDLTEHDEWDATHWREEGLLCSYRVPVAKVRMPPMRVNITCDKAVCLMPGEDTVVVCKAAVAGKPLARADFKWALDDDACEDYVRIAGVVMAPPAEALEHGSNALSWN